MAVRSVICIVLVYRVERIYPFAICLTVFVRIHLGLYARWLAVYWCALYACVHGFLCLFYGVIDFSTATKQANQQTLTYKISPV